MTTEESSLNDVEAALGTVLPTTEDWRRGVDRLHGRA